MDEEGELYCEEDEEEEEEEGTDGELECRCGQH